MRFDSANDYPWQNVRRSDLRATRQDRRMQWVILLAFLCSVILHALLIYCFTGIRIGFSAWQDKAPLVFQIPKVEISEDAITPRPDTDVPSQLDAENLPELLEEKELDLTEIQDRIPDDREIAITPDVKSPSNVSPGGAHAAAGMALESLNPEALDNSLETLTKQSLKAPDYAPISDNQPILVADADTTESGKTRDLLNQAARGNEGISEGFATLDELLGVPGGKLTDISKPIYMPSDLLFEFREDRLRDAAKTSLMMLGILIARNPDTIFVIEGHTDSIGSEESNLDLSRRRANAVSQWLQESLLIPADRMRVEAFGESKTLVAPTGTIEEQQPNRRVEIRMLRTAKPADAAPTQSPTELPPVLPAKPIDESLIKAPPPTARLIEEP